MISANISNETRRKIYRRDGYRCALCDDPRSLQIHHIIPRGRGGTNLPANLITLCWRCHAIAHGTTFPELPDANPAYMELACIEYISDYYAEMYGEPWNPWKKDGTVKDALDVPAPSASDRRALDG